MTTVELTLKIIIALVFGLACVAKLTGRTKDVFIKAGYSVEFMYTIAALQCIMVINLFTEFEVAATAGLLIIMIGAVVTLLRQHAQPSKHYLAVSSIALLVALLMIITS